MIRLIAFRREASRDAGLFDKYDWKVVYASRSRTSMKNDRLAEASRP
jgi:hypothetical protein